MTVDNTRTIRTQSVRTPRPYDPTNNRGRGYEHLWAIYPDYWNEKKWGPKPLLGHVRADTEFDAKYAAYDKGLLIVNCTFGPEPVLQASGVYAERTSRYPSKGRQWSK